jgi:hypothetical protein
MTIGASRADYNVAAGPWLPIDGGCFAPTRRDVFQQEGEWPNAPRETRSIRNGSTQDETADNRASSA